MKRLLPLSLLLVAAAACSDDNDSPLDAGQLPDGSTRDGSVNADGSFAGGDTAHGDGPPSNIAAVPNARCALVNRLGIIEVTSVEVGSAVKHYVTSFVYTGKDPRLGNIVEENAVCRHHRLTVVPGAFMPERPKDMSLTVTAGAQKQDFAPAAPTWDLSGEITLPGDAFAIELRMGGSTVSVPPTKVPAPLDNVTERLTGTLDAPNVLTVTWANPNQDTRVYSLIPINHHAGGPTFTECLVPSATASFTVPKSMLTPLAVSTGLEFQGVRHLRHFAAETPKGCIEFHYFSSMPPNLMTQ